ncbi:MAG: ribosome biogenesis GTPase YlqF, partial [Oscillospiraceae bacterium]|nr:ribosome biogenesis GTPase YlqF [Oscillospiraceae bacterium]
MQLDQLSWFPGHMTKTRRMITAEIANMDAVCEIIDARIPMSSRNPDLDELTAGKPRIVVLNRVDQADSAQTKRWAAYFRSLGYAVIEVDAKSGAGVKQFAPAVRSLLKDKIAAYESKGQVGRVLRVMILGIPNVGKSTFINKVSGRKSAKAEDRPGVTRGKQWVPVDKTLELLDTPGILWPKFEDPEVGVRLAFTGAIRDDVIDTEELAGRLMSYLGAQYPAALLERYKITVEEGEDGFALLEKAGRKRGFLISGGEVDTERMSRILLDEFRGGKLGRFTLELPPEGVWGADMADLSYEIEARAAGWTIVCGADEA